MRSIAMILVFGVIAAATGRDKESVRFVTEGDRIDVIMDGRPITAFHYAAKWDKPFLWPIVSANGTLISRGWPIQPRPGESADHVWHRGFWWGHGDVNGEDFWREKEDKSTSRLVVNTKPTTAGSSLKAQLAMMSSKGKRIGTVTETFVFDRDGANILIDSTIVVGADANEVLRFGDTDDGGFAFRLSEQFRQDRGAILTNSEGQKGTEQIWGQPAKWVDYTATVSGSPIGVTMIDHPSNQRYPTRWHARGYSLNAANPFALRSFTKNKEADGSYTLPAGQQLRLRYLVVIHEGELSRERIEQYAKRFGAR
jgi:hypothetical protein